MNFDLRLPIGILFTLYGLVLAGYGAATRDTKIYERSLNLNINLVWGLVMLAFGAVMLLLACRSRCAAKAEIQGSANASKPEPKEEVTCS